jgi:hypothetical protein
MPEKFILLDLFCGQHLVRRQYERIGYINTQFVPMNAQSGFEVVEQEIALLNTAGGGSPY